jgi:hypothetical protein
MYVRLNLATNPLLSHRRFLAGSAVVGVLGLLLFLGLGWRAHQLRKAEEDLRARSSKIDKEMATVDQQREALQEYFEKQEAAGFQSMRNSWLGCCRRGASTGRRCSWTWRPLLPDGWCGSSRSWMVIVMAFCGGSG